MKLFFILFYLLIPISFYSQSTELELFFNKYTNTFLLNNYIEIIKKDKVNGYIEFGTSKFKTDDPFFENNYLMAQWKIANGNSIFGVFDYYCFGGGCYGTSFKKLKFYDKNLNDITIMVCQIEEIEKLAIKSTFDVNGIFNAWQYYGEKVFVEIPQFGTTIKLYLLAVDASVLAEKNFADLIFNKTIGKFILQKK